MKVRLRRVVCFGQADSQSACRRLAGLRIGISLPSHVIRGRRAGAVQDRIPTSSRTRSTATGIDSGAGPLGRFRGGLRQAPRWRRINLAARHPLASRFAVNWRTLPGPATQQITPWWPCSLLAPTGGASPLVPPSPTSRPSYARSWFLRNI